MIQVTKMGHRFVLGATFAYFLIPCSLFLFCWIKPCLSLPIIVFAIFSAYLAIKTEPFALTTPAIVIQRRDLLIAVVLAIAWCVLSGIGGFVAQTDDHHYRNAVFRDLMSHPWPVIFDVNGEKMLFVYYFVYWLPAALVAKVFGMPCGEVILLGWTCLGILFFWYHVVVFLKRASIVIPLTLVAFSSGCDIMPYLWTGKTYHFYEHIEWWNECFQYSSLTTCLFWVFNQAVPVWIGTALILNMRSIYSKSFVAALIYPFAPFGFIGIAIYLVFYYSIKTIREKRFDCLQEAQAIVQFLPRLVSLCASLSIIAVTSAFFSTTGRGTSFYWLGGGGQRRCFPYCPLVDLGLSDHGLLCSVVN